MASALLPLSASMLLAASLLSAQPESLPNLPAVSLEGFETIIRDEIQEAYQEAQSNPQNGSAVGRLGMLLHAHDRQAAAALCYERAHLLQPHSFKWAYYLGLVQAELGDQEKALTALTHAAELRPNHLPVRLRLAQTLLAAGRVPESQNVFETLAREHPDAAEVHYGLGQAASALRDTARAVEHYRRASQLRPEFAASHYALALALRSLGQSGEAEKHMALYREYRGTVYRGNDALMSEIYRLRTGSREYLEEGLRLQEEGRIEEAVQAYKRVLEVDPERMQAHINLIAAYLKLGKLEEAEAHYKEAIRINPNLPEVHYNHGLLLSRQGKENDAARAFRNALEMNPYHAEAHNNLGYVLFRAEKWPEAENHFRQALLNRPEYRIARYNLARLLLNRGDSKEAIDHLLRIVSEEDTETPLYLYTLADACSRVGRLEEAIGYARKARDLANRFGQTDLATRIDQELKIAREAVGETK